MAVHHLSNHIHNLLAYHDLVASTALWSRVKQEEKRKKTVECCGVMEPKLEHTGEIGEKCL